MELAKRGCVCQLVLAYTEERLVRLILSENSVLQWLAFGAVVRPHLTADNMGWKKAIHLIAARKQRKREKEEVTYPLHGHALRNLSFSSPHSLKIPKHPSSARY